MPSNPHLDPKLSRPVLEESDGPITTTGSKDFPVLRQEMGSPQGTLGHLVTAAAQELFLRTFSFLPA